MVAHLKVLHGARTASDSHHNSWARLKSDSLSIISKQYTGSNSDIEEKSTRKGDKAKGIASKAIEQNERIKTSAQIVQE